MCKHVLSKLCFPTKFLITNFTFKITRSFHMNLTKMQFHFSFCVEKFTTWFKRALHNFSWFSMCRSFMPLQMRTVYVRFIAIWLGAFKSFHMAMRELMWVQSIFSFKFQITSWIWARVLICRKEWNLFWFICRHYFWFFINLINKNENDTTFNCIFEDKIQEKIFWNLTVAQLTLSHLKINENASDVTFEHSQYPCASNVTWHFDIFCLYSSENWPSQSLTQPANRCRYCSDFRLF